MRIRNKDIIDCSNRIKNILDEYKFPFIIEQGILVGLENGLFLNHHLNDYKKEIKRICNEGDKK